jgi:hypothetical protein
MQNTKILGVTPFPQGKKQVPGFRIAGKWLKNLGFNYGDYARIQIQENGNLMISKVEGKQNDYYRKV